jgi:quercetin dioxygenase-like cupin family protein
MKATVMYDAGDVRVETVPDAQLIEPTDAAGVALTPAPSSTYDNGGDMEITRSSIETTPGPGEWFTGSVYIDAVAAPSSPPRALASQVHFTPGARTAWHTHPNGQTIFVLEGVGRAQRRGGPVEVIRPGDRVFFEPGEEHWHGAAPDRFMAHIAIVDVDAEGTSATWGEHVTDEEYRAAPRT